MSAFGFQASEFSITPNSVVSVPPIKTNTDAGKLVLQLLGNLMVLVIIYWILLQILVDNGNFSGCSQGIGEIVLSCTKGWAKHT
jgi:hypothetical protein